MKFPRREYPRPVWWVALSPEYTTHPGGEYEPDESGRDFLWVRARSAHRAKVLAIRAWRRGWWHGCTTRKGAHFPSPYVVRYNDENPMTAVTIERTALAGDRWGYRVRA